MGVRVWKKRGGRNKVNGIRGLVDTHVRERERDNSNGVIKGREMGGLGKRKG